NRTARRPRRHNHLVAGSLISATLSQDSSRRISNGHQIWKICHGGRGPPSYGLSTFAPLTEKPEAHCTDWAVFGRLYEALSIRLYSERPSCALRPDDPTIRTLGQESTRPRVFAR